MAWIEEVGRRSQKAKHFYDSETGKFRAELVAGCTLALSCFWLFGNVGIFADFDHVVCKLLFPDTVVFDHTQGQYGCRMLHPAYLIGGWLCYSISGPFGIGLLTAMVIKTARSTARSKQRK